jgi:hypothetical protein
MIDYRFYAIKNNLEIAYAAGGGHADFRDSDPAFVRATVAAIDAAEARAARVAAIDHEIDAINTRIRGLPRNAGVSRGIFLARRRLLAGERTELIA